MTIPDPLNPLLVECVGCIVDCADIQLDPQQGIIPRGFCWGSGTIADKDLMVIFPEPAGADSSERWRYRRAKRSGGWDCVAAEADQVATEIWMEENNEDSDAGTLWFLRNYREVWASFVPDDVAKKVDEALADEG